MLPLRALELQPEGLLERGSKGCEGWDVASLDPRPRVARVGGEEPGDILRGGKGGGVEKDPLHVFEETVAVRLGERPRVHGGAPEPLLVASESEGLQLGRVPLHVLSQEDEVAQVGHEHMAVLVPISPDLLAVGCDPGVLPRPLHLDHAATGNHTCRRVRFLLVQLVLGEETSIGEPRTAVLEGQDAAHFRT